MTARDGNYIGAGSNAEITQLFSGEAGNAPGVRADDGFFVGTPNAAASVIYYKNQGYYVAGTVYEEWITSGAPSIIAPSGHTLTGYSHQVIG